MKKRLIVSVIVLIAAALLWWNAPVALLPGKTAENTASVAVFSGNTGNSFALTDKDDIRFVADNIQRASLRKSGISLLKMGYGYRLTFCGKDGKTLKTLIINSDSKIRRDPFFYDTADSLNLIDFLCEAENAAVKEK